MHVVKNSFLKRAMTDSGLPDVGEQLTGQTAVVTGEKDVAPVAKILKTFAAEFKIAALKIGVVDQARAFDRGSGNAGRSAVARSSAGAVARSALGAGDALVRVVERAGSRRWRDS